MSDKRDIFENALKNTRILKMPRQNLATFGTTNIEYYVLSSLDGATRVREGKVISSRPQIIKMGNVTELFEGFGEYSEYAEDLFDLFGKNPKILNYRFKNQSGTMSDSSKPLEDVFESISVDIQKRGKSLAAVIEGMETTWQISIMKLIVEMTLKSAGENIADLEERGMFPDEKGIPQYIRNRIEYLFKAGKRNRLKVNQLGKLLNQYGLFKEYEDRFFKLLEKK